MSGKGAPPLPPRQPSAPQYGALPSISTEGDDADTPPPYETIYDQSTANHLWASHDSRASSTQSLLPIESHERAGRRRLLLVYVHGFMGNETSFRSFPAHVHHLLVVLLADTHVVHSKIYPRYRSKRNISFARDDFGRWLEPHEDASTDVVLLGHSMGGLLSAEVVLMPASQGSGAFKHRILGTINLDVPFLGMHPGVVKSGLASIFSPPGAPQDTRAESIPPNSAVASASASSDSIWDPEQRDPNFNPAFQNDTVLPVRNGWRSAWHFVSKHSDDLFQASKKLVASHMEFGGAMANYSELKTRYTRLRALEVDDERVRMSVVKDGPVPSRVRFVNYYTASTGRPKKPKETSRPSNVDSAVASNDLANPEEDDLSRAAETLTIGHPEDANNSLARSPSGLGRRLSSGLGTSLPIPEMPQIPELPQAPPALDVSYIEDAQTRKLVESEHARAVKAYEQAVKDRERAMKDQTALGEGQGKLASKTGTGAGQVAKRAGKQALGVNDSAEAHTQKQESGQMTHEQNERLRLEKERQRMETEARRMHGGHTSAPHPQISDLEGAESDQVPPFDAATSADSLEPETSVPPSAISEQREDKAAAKQRTFCTLPPKDSNGQRDPCWVRVLMNGVDEVGAHCGLFFVDERYERLVGEVAERIEQWVKEDQHDFDLD